MDVEPIRYMLDSQGCGKDSDASFKTLVDLYDTTIRALQDKSIPAYR